MTFAELPNRSLFAMPNDGRIMRKMLDAKVALCERIAGGLAPGLSGYRIEEFHNPSIVIPDNQEVIQLFLA